MGPMGQGPMSGRGMGWCGGANAEGNARQGGRGFGMGRDRGRGFQGRAGGGRHGWRHCFNATGMPGWMRAKQVERFEEALGEMTGRIQALEALAAAATPPTEEEER